MRKVIADEWMTLDGVIQAPGQADEDPSAGFAPRRLACGLRQRPRPTTGGRQRRHRGWVLLGRRTYEIFEAHWPKAGEEQVLAEPLNTKPKYVASRTLTEPLAWQNATVLQGDLAQAVTALKQEDGQDLHVIGSSELVRTLFAQDLVDEFQAMIDPVVVGGASDCSATTEWAGRCGSRQPGHDHGRDHRDLRSSRGLTCGADREGQVKCDAEWPPLPGVVPAIRVAGGPNVTQRPLLTMETTRNRCAHRRFSQVTPKRRGHSDRFSFGTVLRSPSDQVPVVVRERPPSPRATGL